MTAAIEAQVERFAPGFRDCILARATKDAAAMEAYDANYVGGDINGGIADWRQLLFRPVVSLEPVLDPGPGASSCARRPRRPAAASTAWAAARRPRALDAMAGAPMTAHGPADTRLAAHEPRADAARRRARIAGGASRRAVLSDAGGMLLVLSYGMPGLDPRGPPPAPADRVAAAPDGARPRPRDDARHRVRSSELLAGTADPLGEFTAWANGTGWVFVLAGFMGLCARLSQRIPSDGTVAGGSAGCSSRRPSPW